MNTISFSRDSAHGVGLGLSLFALICLLWPAVGMAGEEVIGRMRAAIWPEYDDPGILAIYDGRFTDVSAFPMETSFYIPKGAVVSDACSLSPEGQHFCQLFTTKPDGEWDEVMLKMPYPNFYLSFHVPIDPEQINPESGWRKVDYTIRSNHAIQTLEVDVQEPLRASGFTIDPPGATRAEDKGFNHYRYELNDIKAGEQKVITVGYAKSDQRPSVDIKYSRMDGPKVWGSPYETQKQARVLVYLMFGIGVILMIGMGAWFFVKRREA
ncbi:MAG: hypothetical protein HQL52_11785 [Magnetococcales bacterium]|nr:hypothetical protein [Magnetococcales bacterium]